MVQPYGNTGEIEKMKGIYEAPSFAKEVWGNEDIGVKWRGNLPAFSRYKDSYWNKKRFRKTEELSN